MLFDPIPTLRSEAMRGLSLETSNLLIVYLIIRMLLYLGLYCLIVFLC